MEKVAFSKSIIQNTEIICRAIDNKEFTLIDELLECPELPAVYKNMIVAERDTWIFREKLRMEANPCFNFNLKTNLCFEFEKILKSISVLPFNDFRSFIETFVKLRLNFLLRPRTTLKFFVFRESITVSLEQMLKYLAYFSDYEYIYQGFYDYVAQQTEKNKTTISIYEFESLLEKIDNDFVLNLDENEFINLVRPIFEFFTVNLETVPQAPSSAFVIFFTDKKLNYIAYLIENSFKYKNITHDDLLELLKTNLLGIQTEELTSNIKTEAELAIEFEEKAAAEVFDLQEDIDERLSTDFVQEEIEDTLQNDYDFETFDSVELSEANTDDNIIDESVEIRIVQNEKTFDSELIDILNEENQLATAFEEAVEISEELNDAFEQLLEEQNEASSQDELSQSDKLLGTEIIDESELLLSELEEIETNNSNNEFNEIDEELMQFEDINFADAIQDNDEQTETAALDEIPIILQEEMQKLDTIEPKTDEEFQEIYDIERNIIRKACELIAGSTEMKVELPIEIGDIEEIPVFENADDLSTSLTSFLSKIINEETENIDVINATIDNDILEENNIQPEPIESDLLSDFATSDFDNVEIDDSDFEEQNQAFEIDIEGTQVNLMEYELVETSGELVEQKNVTEEEKSAREILAFNEELLEKMKLSDKNKINLSEEEIDIDLLLLNRKEDDNEVR